MIFKLFSGLKYDVWEILPPKLAQDIFAGAFIESLAIIGLRYAEVTSSRVTLTIVNKKRGITAETALALSDALKTTPEFWLNLVLLGRWWKCIQNPK